MKLRSLFPGVLLFGLTIGLVNSPLFAGETNGTVKATAKISKKEAKKIALAKVPNGKIKQSELEEEKGKLIWSFDIATPHSKDITEVQVDAVTGEVVSVEKESPADEKKEKQKDAK